MKLVTALHAALEAGPTKHAGRNDPETRAAMIASLRANGYEIVPKKPTKQMIEIGQQWFVGWMDSSDPHSENGVKSIYAVMLMAAQENDDGR